MDRFTDGLLGPAPALRAGVGLEPIVCGIDGSEDSLAAAREAARILPPGGRLVLLAALDPTDLVIAGRGRHARTVVRSIVHRVNRALRIARRAAPPHATVEQRLARGPAAALLLTEAERRGAALIAVGVRGLTGLTPRLGRTALAVLRDARCSVLIGRAPPAREVSRIVVGIDGSEPAGDALSVAMALARSMGAELKVVAATGGKPVDEDTLARGWGVPVVLDPRRPADALVTAGASARLVVVGSRGLHGWRRIGSVSSRVARRAPCSVLVVRARSAERPGATAAGRRPALVGRSQGGDGAS